MCKAVPSTKNSLIYFFPNQQLREAFKFVVADKLFVQNTGSNCIADNDKILLDVSSIAMAKM